METAKFNNELDINVQQQIEENIKLQNAEAQQQKTAQKQEWINNCIKNAYTALKNLQANSDSIKIVMCSTDASNCSDNIEYWNKVKEDDFKKYENEWVPQCKLGNKVYLDYTYCSPNDMLAGTCK